MLQIQSIVAAALLLMLAFGVNDGSSAPPAAPDDAVIQVACDQPDDYGTFGKPDPGEAAVSPCGGPLQR